MKARTQSSRVLGYTMTEIMVVVAVIGLLAVLSIPAFIKARVQSQTNRFLNDLRIASDAFNIYNMTVSRWPPDTMPGAVPAGMEPDLAKVGWTEGTSIGGQWDWDFNVFGVTAGVSVYQPSRTEAEMAKIDKVVDDGDITTGRFRQRAQGYIYVLDE